MTIISSIPWIKQVKSRTARHEELLQCLGAELEKNSAFIDHEKCSVNLCLFDGGGMKGKQKQSSYIGVLCSRSSITAFLVMSSKPISSPKMSTLLP